MRRGVLHISEAEHTVGNATNSHSSSTITDGESITQKINDEKILSGFSNLIREEGTTRGRPSSTKSIS